MTYTRAVITDRLLCSKIIINTASYLQVPNPWPRIIWNKTDYCKRKIVSKVICQQLSSLCLGKSRRGQTCTSADLLTKDWDKLCNNVTCIYRHKRTILNMSPCINILEHAKFKDECTVAFNENVTGFTIYRVTFNTVLTCKISVVHILHIWRVCTIKYSQHP